MLAFLGIWKSAHNKEFCEDYVRSIRKMNRGAKARIRSNVGLTDSFRLKVGVYQELALSLFLSSRYWMKPPKAK